MSFILADGCVVTMNGSRDILDRGSILIEGDRIAGIGTAAQLSQKSARAETAGYFSRALWTATHCANLRVRRTGVAAQR